MSKAPDELPTPSATDPSAWRQIEGRLSEEKRRLYAEIRNYPTPIAGCDQQFNYLLERQANLVADLRRLQAAIMERTAEGSTAPAADPLDVVRRFLESTSLDDAIKHRLSADLQARGSSFFRDSDIG